MSNVTDLIKFSSPPMVSRWLMLLETAEGHRDKLNKRLRSAGRVEIDYGRLYIVHISTYYDIYRYKVMHLDDPNKSLSDCVKRAAYYAKWIVKHKPYFMVRKSYEPNQRDRGVLVNEDFAVRWAHANLQAELKKRSGKSMPVLAPRKLYELLYDLHYREISDDALIHIFQVHYDIAAGSPYFLKTKKV